MSWAGIAVGLLCLLSLGLASVGLGRLPFWVDESIAVLPARAIHVHGVPQQPFDLDFMPFQVVDGVWDPATPAYRYALAAFTALVGFSETTTRLFSLLLGGAAAGVFGLVAAGIRGRRVGFYTAALLATSPAFLSFAREARHHTFVMLTCGLALLALLRLTDDRPPGWARMAWLPLVLLALLGHPMAWLLLPLVLVFFLLWGWPAGLRTSSAKQAQIWFMALLVFAIIVLPSLTSLPFLHEVSCRNRPAGCHPSWLHYLPVAYAFLSGLSLHGLDSGQVAGLGLAVGPALFLAGTAVAVHRSLPGRTDRHSAFALAWLLLPLALLSIQEVKFPRYLYVWFGPAAAVLMAVGMDALTGRAGPRFRRITGVALLSVCVLWPSWRVDAAGGASGVRSGLMDYFRTEVLDGPSDNWQEVRAQVSFLEGRLRPEDVVVSSLDDASLGYYLGRPVYSFLNSRRDDAFFLALLDATAVMGGQVYFIDTLPRLNFCFDGPLQPVTVDCREKFSGFYAACHPGSGQTHVACTRLVFPSWLR